MMHALSKIVRIGIILSALFLGITVNAAAEDSRMLENLRRMRLKQQDQEYVVRAQVFKNIQQERNCTPVQQTRQRLREVETGHGKTSEENVVINAGNEEVNVTDNHGTINSNVNVQIIKDGDETPCP